MTNPQHQYPLVLVEWVDSNEGPSGWEDMDDLADVPPIDCRSVGHLLDNTEDRITIACTVSPNQILKRVTIPKCAVKRVANLTEAREPQPTKKTEEVRCASCDWIITECDDAYRDASGTWWHGSCAREAGVSVQAIAAQQDDEGDEDLLCGWENNKPKTNRICLECGQPIEQGTAVFIDAMGRSWHPQCLPRI